MYTGTRLTTEIHRRLFSQFFSEGGGTSVHRLEKPREALMVISGESSLDHGCTIDRLLDHFSTLPKIRKVTAFNIFSREILPEDAVYLSWWIRVIVIKEVILKVYPDYGSCYLAIVKSCKLSFLKSQNVKTYWELISSRLRKKGICKWRVQSYYSWKLHDERN